MNDKNFLELKNAIAKSLKLLRLQIDNPLSDAHADFFPSVPSSIEKALSLLDSSELTLETIEKIKVILGFEKIFPLIEMAEKLEELEETVFSTQKSEAYSYTKIGVPIEYIESSLEEKKLILQMSMMEGLFRKGVSKTDREAWSGIYYNMSGRTLYDYIHSIVNGWLHKDLICKWLEDEIKKEKEYKDIVIKRSDQNSLRIFRYKKKFKRNLRILTFS